ncbi:MAG: DNA-binding transcriptional ArsR family regulator [Arenicella sp.]|jgi:DNA-binding transcriptional ArsR family regulator
MITTKREMSLDKLAKVAQVLKTISHPVRLEILEALEEEEPLAVGEILERVDAKVEQCMLSHHLIKMKDNGILTSEKQGKHIYYSLTDRQVLNIFDCMEKCDFL